MNEKNSIVVIALMYGVQGLQEFDFVSCVSFELTICDPFTC